MSTFVGGVIAGVVLFFLGMATNEFIRQSSAE